MLLVAGSLWPSGRTRHVVDLACGLAGRGHTVRVAARTGAGDPRQVPYADRLRACGATVDPYGHAIALVRMAAAAHPDLIHIHDERLLGLGPLLTAASGRPWVATVHGLGLGRPPFSDALGTARAVAAVHADAVAELRDAGVEAWLLPNAVDLEAFRPGPKGPGRVITYCSRWDPGKDRGFRTFFDACRHLPPEVRVLVASNRAPSLERADFLGWVADPAPVLARSDVAVGAERTIREGMAAGNACLLLGTGYGGVVDPDHPREERWHGTRGLPEPDPAAIRADLTRLLADASALRSLQVRGRKYAERHFRLDTWLDTTERFYRHALG